MIGATALAKGFVTACLLLGPASSLVSIASAAQPSIVGRVSVTAVQEPGDSGSLEFLQILEARYAPSPGKSFADVRIISVRPYGAEPSVFEATIYDYTVEHAFDVVFDAKGKEISRQPLPFQPAVSPAELQDAQAIVNQAQSFAEGLAGGSRVIYEAMPPTTVDPYGRRLINVGVMSPPEAAHALEANEIVSVHIPTGKIVRHESGAPPTSLAGLLACGPAGQPSCPASSGSCTSSYHVEWPAANPVWKLNVRHPSCTNTGTLGQPDGTGLELTDVYYKDSLVLQSAHMPVLNVKYQGNTCGPYRDWLDSEDCFQATGTDVPATGSGIRVTTGNPAPGTLCETGVDTGSFKGVAIHDLGSSLWLVTETNAGWYRYVMEWRLYLDGTIEPIIGFGATSNNCTCNAHFHHGYWRFEWALDGTSGNPATGITTLERRRAGTTDQYDPIATEGTFLRPASNYQDDWFRVKNPATGTTYLVKPGPLDGHANGDTYGKWDLAALAYNIGQIDDQNPNTSIELGTWPNGEPLGAAKRLVTWYHATYDHNDPGGAGEPCELAGPRLVFVSPCAGSVSLDRDVYACGSTIALAVDDQDLRNTGTLNVAVSSPTEPAPETKTLVETPAGSGHFSGTMPTLAGAPVHGDGAISIADGNTVNVRYVDASSCGTPNVPVDKAVTIDCVSPVIANVAAGGITGSSATITWTTNESATSVAHWGLAPPGASTASDSDPHTAHSVLLTGLSECSTYYYWLESADLAGNSTATNAGGGYFAFTTARNVQPSYASAGSPVPIPDNNSTGATSTITVTPAMTVLDANVTVNVTHTYDNDLVLSLITPTSASITLSNRRGSGDNNFVNTVFDDEAATAISSGTAPFTGSFRPDALLSSADGLGSAGAWQLKVVDMANIDTGTIDSWTLTLTHGPGSCPSAAPPSPVPDGTIGSSMTASRAATNGSKIDLGWDVSTCSNENYHLLYGPLDQVSAYTLGGGVCALGPLGSYTWSDVPAGSLWFVVVGNDAAGTEGSWGRASSGAERGGATPSGTCGLASRDNSGTCP